METTSITMASGGAPATTPGTTPEGAPGTTPATTPSVDRPAWLPEKFQKPEDLGTAYAELEKKYSEVTAKKLADTEARNAGRLNKQFADKGLDVAALSQEFAEKGRLSVATYGKMAEAGLSEEAVDQFIAGQQALAKQSIAVAYESAGGEEQYAAMTAWAKDNWSPELQDAFNKAVTTGDETQMHIAIRGLLADYLDASGDEPDLVQGGAGGSNEPGYGSQQELQADMRDPRYQSGDEAFHKKVYAKLARSRIA